MYRPAITTNYHGAYVCLGDADDLYCNVGTANTCDARYDEVYCGKISAGYKCVRSATKTTTIVVPFIGLNKKCTYGYLSCQPKVSHTLAKLFLSFLPAALPPSLTCISFPFRDMNALT